MANPVVFINGDGVEITSTNALPVIIYTSGGVEIGNSQTSKIIVQEE